MCGIFFRAMDVRLMQYLGTVDRGHKGPRRRAGARRLRRKEKLAAARVAVEIGDNSEEAVNINETATG